MVNKVIQILFFLLFVSVIASYGVSTFTHPEFGTTEKRKLAPWPEKPHTFQQLVSWPEQFEAYLNDHLNHRTALIHGFNWVRMMAGISPQKGVVIGKNKWLYSSNSGIIDDYRNIDLFTDEELKNWIDYLKHRQHHAEQNGYVYTFVVTPNKASIHPEYLPDHITPVQAQSRLDQLLTAAEQAGIHLLDLRPPLIEAKQQGQVYVSGDTHWNLRGAEVAHAAIVAFLKPEFPQLQWQRLPAEEFQLLPRNKFHEHGLHFYAGNIGMLGMLRDKYFYDEQPAHPSTFEQNLEFEIGLIQGEYFERFNDNKRARFYFETHHPEKPYRLLVYRDSFTSAMQKYISETFGYAAFIWLKPKDDFFIENVKLLSPDIVIEQRVERHLTQVPQPGINYPPTSNPLSAENK